jgi:hypothetical protein
MFKPRNTTKSKTTKTETEVGLDAIEMAINEVNGVEPAFKKEVENEEEVITSRERPKRRKVYERASNVSIPDELKNFYAKQGYELRFIRWSIHGEPDYRYLNKRVTEGYEFVTADEIPATMLKALRVVNNNVANGMITNGDDLCLMKVDSDLRRSRRKYFDDLTEQQISAVSANVTKRNGYFNNSKSRVSMREPSFQD